MQRSVRQTGRVSDTRNAILAAASELLNSAGLESITIRNVGTAANFGRSTVVHHFGDKEGLLDALHLVALGDLSAAVMDSRFEIYTEPAKTVFDRFVGLGEELEHDDPRQPGFSLFPRFKLEYPGFWQILRFRPCPNFARDDLPEVWGLVNALADGNIGAPIGPTIDMIVHQVLALHDWVAVASPADALRIAEIQPSTAYWLSVFDRG